MKSISRVVVVFFILLGLTACSSGSSEVSVDVPDGVEQEVGVFLDGIEGGQLEDVYSSTTQAFRDSLGFDKFEKMVKIGRLRELSSLVWVAQSEVSDTGLSLDSLFTLNDGKQMSAHFNMVQDNDGWNVDGFSLDLTTDVVSMSFPVDDALVARVRNDLIWFEQVLLDEEKAGEFYDGMSTVGRDAFSRESFDELLESIRRGQMDIIFSADDQLEIAEHSPQFAGSQAVVEGQYEKDGKTVLVKFVYDFEWEWRISVFVIDDEGGEES
jgi:hypothetical protein